jgi:hypothetical protein
MLHLGQLIIGHPAPGREFNVCPGISGYNQNPAPRFLVADIEVEIHDDPAAGLLTTVKFIVKIPGGISSVINR